MAVYTKIDKKDISYINQKFKVEKIINFKGIKQGIENTNYLLKSKKNKFILTIFEKRVSKKEIPFFMKLMDKLNDSKINCPKPLINKNGNYLIKIKNKTACIVSFLEGKDKKSLNLKNCYDIGKIIAQMHLTTEKIKLYRKNSMGIKNLNPLLNSIKFKSKKFTNIDKFLKVNFRDIKKKWPKSLPNGIIHGDLFIDNIFFKNNKLSGIIDFYFAANDYFMYEIAICVNALCFDKKNSKFIINKKKIKNLIKGYEAIKKISNKEKKSLNILCRAASLRYFLTRLYDYTNTPKTALIKIKDPREYYQKLVIHNNLNTYKDYLK
ncbi:homoserine kinase [Pelagibacterales bacterium SAG-MED01]|nr:homoserine kinase [Pelagibacterales bacterium SAG-MED01]